jgi:hypothetical protein
MLNIKIRGEQTNKKKITKKPNREKKLIKILKKPTGSVWFRFYKAEPKAEPKKPSQTGKNRAKLKNSSQVDLNRFLS